jgi:hypothetical protein
VAAVKGGNRKGKSGKSGKKNNKQRSHSPGDEKKSPLCWLHIRFGDKARRCDRRGAVAAACPGNLNTTAAGRLFFVYDAVSAKKLLVDTGSSFSIFPFRSAARPSGLRLKAANGQRIRCWGSRRWELRIADKVYKCQFLQADVSFPILGADFLRHFELLVDVAGEQLVQCSRQCASDGVFAVNLHLTPDTHHPAAGGPDSPSGCGGSQSAALRGSAAGSTEAPSSVAAAATADWLRIVAEFPAVVQPFTVSSSSPKHGVEHHIDTTSHPVTAKFRRLDQIKQPRRSSLECWRQA